MDAVMEKDYAMEQMQKVIVDLKKRNKRLQAQVHNLKEESEYYRGQYDKLKNSELCVEYLELCKKCHEYQKTIDTLAIRLGDVLRGT